MNTVKFNLLRIFSFIIIMLSVTACTEPPYTNLDNTQLKALVDQGTPVFDIRRSDEWRQTGVIKNSQLLTFVDNGGRLLPNFLPTFTQKIGKNDPVILICRTGNRSSALAKHLIENMGYTNIYNVRNGISSWISDKQPVSRL